MAYPPFLLSLQLPVSEEQAYFSSQISDYTTIYTKLVCYHINESIIIKESGLDTFLFLSVLRMFRTEFIIW